MNGVSNMLPFVIGGGILLIALLIVFVVNPLVSAINAALNGFLQNMGTSSRVLLGILLGA